MNARKTGIYKNLQIKIQESSHRVYLKPNTEIITPTSTVYQNANDK